MNTQTQRQAERGPNDREGGLSTADMVGAGRTTGDMATPNRPQPNQPQPNQPQPNQPQMEQRPSATAGPQANGATRNGSTTPLLPAEQAGSYRTRWDDIQTGFVDEPRKAVEQADHLVAEVIKRVAEIFADERGKLETQWSRGDEVDTEDLRLALQRYRSFFERLLAA